MDSDALCIPEITARSTEQPHVARATEVVTQPVRKPDIEAIVPFEAQEVYKNSLFLEKLRKQQALKPFGDLDPVALFSDIDGTYIPTKPKTPEEQIAFEAHRENTTALTQLLEQQQVPLSLVSGRDITLIQPGQKGGAKYELERLPHADLLIGAVGTEIHVLQPDGTYAKDTEYERHLREQIGYDRAALYPLLRAQVGLQRHLQPDLDLHFQGRDSEKNVDAWAADPEAKKNGITTEEPPQAFKISLDCKGENIDALRASMRQMMDTNGFEKVKMVVSSSTSQKSGAETVYHIDIVPVTKKDAIDYVSERANCMGIVAGDSGNDEDMIREAGGVGVMVANARPELTTMIHEQRRGPKVQGFTRLVIDGKKQNRVVWHDPDKEKNNGPTSLLAAARSLTRYNQKLQAVRSRPLSPSSSPVV